MKALEIIGIIGIVLFVFEIFIVSAYLVFSKNHNKNEMIIYSDVQNSLKEQVPILIVDNIRKDEFLSVQNSDIILYATGMEIPGIAFKSDDIEHGIRIALTGVMESNMTIICTMGATKNNLWQISFDKGVTKHSLLQISNNKEAALAIELAKKFGWTSTTAREKITEEILRKSKKIKDENFELDDLPNRLLSNFNHNLATETTLRFQSVISTSENALTIAGGGSVPNVNFYYTYEGKLYKFKSAFVGKQGNLFEWDFYDLEPGRSYVGITYELNNNGIFIPSSALYGVTKKSGDVATTFDKAKLFVPNQDEESFPMWNEIIIKEYMGAKPARLIYDHIVKKHYEKDNPEQVIDLKDVPKLHSQYPWLYVGGTTPEIEELTLNLIQKMRT